jgi:hypothetical protein
LHQALKDRPIITVCTTWTLMPMPSNKTRRTLRRMTKFLLRLPELYLISSVSQIRTAKRTSYVKRRLRTLTLPLVDVSKMLLPLPTFLSWLNSSTSWMEWAPTDGIRSSPWTTQSSSLTWDGLNPRRKLRLFNIYHPKPTSPQLQLRLKSSLSSELLKPLLYSTLRKWVKSLFKEM